MSEILASMVIFPMASTTAFFDNPVAVELRLVCGTSLAFSFLRDLHHGLWYDTDVELGGKTVSTSEKSLSESS